MNYKLLLRLSPGASALACALLLAPAAQADSLWKDDAAPAMFSDKRATKVGDIITILVQENATASKDNNTKTAKSTGVDASISSFLYDPTVSGFMTKGGKYPALKFDAKQNFDGGGSINNSEKITARIAVKVIDVLPNRQMIVEGRRETSFSGEKQEAVLRGSVRSEDVMANNTVFSYDVADATIRYTGRGTISDNQRKGWFVRIWEKLTPF